VSRGQCTLCGDVVESKHRHDFVWCKCKESFLDGGDVYWRAGGAMMPISEESYSGEEFLRGLEEMDMEVDDEQEESNTK
jgi:hypothetical protein